MPHHIIVQEVIVGVQTYIAVYGCVTTKKKPGEIDSEVSVTSVYKVIGSNRLLLYQCDGKERTCENGHTFLWMQVCGGVVEKVTSKMKIAACRKSLFLYVTTL